MSGDAIRVFFADDHAMVRQGLADMAAAKPDLQVVGQCGDGICVLPEVLDAQPDVLVLDISMPGLNGLDVCQEVTRRAPYCRVLIVSMHTDHQFIARAIQNGAAGYLFKDAPGDQLIEAVRTVAGGGLFLGPDIPPSVLHLIGQCAADPYEKLTLRERQVLHLIAEGLTSREVAERLDRSVKTVDTHRSRLMQKLDIHDHISLVKFALKRGIVPLS